MGILLGFLLVVFTSGCASVWQSAPEGPLQFRDLARGAFSAISEPQQVVIRDQRAWDLFWVKHTAGSAGVKKPEPDFATEMVVALTMGRKNTGGYSISVQGVDAQQERIVVTYAEREPKPGGMTLQALSSPFHFVAAPKRDGKVVFEKAAN